MKENHEIKIEIVNVIRYLNLMKSSIILNEIKEWIKNAWMNKTMRDISIYQEFTCNYCQYYTRNMKSMYEHFSNKYHELKASENNQEYMIQILFKTKLWKYIQVNKFDNEIMRKDDEENDDKEWNKIFEKKFEKNIE